MEGVVEVVEGRFVRRWCLATPTLTTMLRVRMVVVVVEVEPIITTR